jgi:hypothetical protein
MYSKLRWITRWGLVLGVTGCLTAGLWGCCGKHTQRDYGRSVTHNRAVQLLNPRAGREPVVSRGQPPVAAANAYEKYNKSFSPKKEKSLINLTTQE